MEYIPNPRSITRYARDRRMSIRERLEQVRARREVQVIGGLVEQQQLRRGTRKQHRRKHRA